MSVAGSHSRPRLAVLATSFSLVVLVLVCAQIMDSRDTQSLSAISTATGSTHLKTSISQSSWQNVRLQLLADLTVKPWWEISEKDEQNLQKTSVEAVEHQSFQTLKPLKSASDSQALADGICSYNSIQI